jgi:predicted outer membrane protein
MTRTILTALTALSLASFASAQDPQRGMKPASPSDASGQQTGPSGQTGMSDAEVADFIKKYAQMMVAEHTKSNDQVAAVGKSQGVVAQESELSRALRDQAKTENASVVGLEGKDFDQAYIDQQVKAHQTVLQTLDQAMSAGERRGEEFSSLLKQTREAVSKHLEHAQRLQTKTSRAK